LQKEKNKYYPSLFCLGEKIFIAVSNIKVGLGHSKYKIELEHWTHLNARFRSEEYRINFPELKPGLTLVEVKCPKCGSLVDFRMWMSAKRPEFCVPEKSNI
jgi:hypothetical protein